MRDNYIKNIRTDTENLLFYSICELAAHMGHSMVTPLSSSLLCLTFNISSDQNSRIFVEFVQIVEKTPLEELDVSMFKKAMVKHHKPAEDYSELTIKAFIKAYSKCGISKLYPFAETLEL